MKNKTKITVAGIGINDYSNCEKHIQQTWNNMLKRCYSSKFQALQPTYIGCSVDPSWHNLSNFREWFLLSNWKAGLELDKDITNRGNKVYGPANCSFVSSRINSLITDCGRSRGQYKVGVCFNKPTGKFQAKCRVNGKQKHIGLFTTETDAFSAYKTFKETQIKIVAVEEYVKGNCSLDVMNALLKWII